ncbi:M10 family metallopeptidase C-terminal domain-containing protein [Caulobacter segnis]|uniref:M10 family metallopeptidase C-terminal domain-containing protein n=1 Tax=Caulobacter segnis TaxID=88688 RepID=UPI002860ED47|nr:M10 family metallopeptidase C-terminal domain-containing protein [Caulobacter segnis]MDR6627158.1 serralysin [Caulobacter segnis]
MAYDAPLSDIASLADRGGVEANGKASYTTSQAAAQLTRDSSGWSGALGTAATITYAFRSTAPSTLPSDVESFSRFNAAQIAAAEKALLAWSDVANITFSRVGSGTSGEAAYSDDATILFSDYAPTADADGAAFAYYPGSRSAGSRSGDVWVNSALSYNTSPVLGNYGVKTLVHEVGHAIGLSHPADYDASDAATPSYASSAVYFEDSYQYTIMSYFSGANTGASHGSTYAAAPMLDDIAAAQRLYGANMTTRAGDTTYGFNATAGRDWFVATASKAPVVAVWDAGGADTFDFSGYARNQTIDLTPGGFSSVGGYTYNVAIAQGVTIENAIGGSAADIIQGNTAANVLQGNAGSDALYGAQGQDTLQGGAGLDTLWGGDGADSIVGGADFDQINGNAGADTGYGGVGDDWVVGGKDNDVLYGESGADIVYGNFGDDTVDGGEGADWVRGGQGDDIVIGGDGDDWLAGDRGSDTLSGGAGADRFYFFSGAGIDRVTDFVSAWGDRVLLDAGQPYTLSFSGGNAVIDLGGGDQLILVGVTSQTLGDWIVV